MTDNRPILKRAMSSKKVKRKTNIKPLRYKIDLSYRDRLKLQLNFARGLILGVFTTAMFTTQYSTSKLFYLMLILLLITFVVDYKTETVKEKSLPKKIYCS